jgi:hypothetical protein
MSDNIKIKSFSIAGGLSEFKRKYGVNSVPSEAVENLTFCIHNSTNKVYLYYNGEWINIMTLLPEVGTFSINSEELSTRNITIKQLLNELSVKYHINRYGDEGQIGFFANCSILISLKGIWKKIASYTKVNSGSGSDTPPSDSPSQGIIDESTVFQCIEKFERINERAVITVPELEQISDKIEIIENENNMN